MRTAAMIVITLGSVITANSVHAEIGVPANKGGAYLSIEGGYQNNDTTGTAAQGGSETVDGNPGGQNSACVSIAFNFALPGPDGRTCGAAAGTERATGHSDGGTRIEAADGGYGALTFGYVLPSTILGIITRLELAGQLSRTRDDQESLGAFGMRSVDNTAAIAFASVPIERTQVSVNSRFEMTEITLRLKGDVAVGASGALVTLTFEPFYLGTDLDVTTSASSQFGGTVGRTTDVSGDGVGALIGLEAQIPIVTNVFLIGRGYAGLYHLASDGVFKDTFGFAPDHAVTDDEDMDGYRLGGEGGVRINMTPGAWLSFIGKVDWMSEIPIAVLPQFKGDLPAHIEDDDLLVWQIGVRLTLTGN